ncbi:hypothetical protein FRC00_008830, partial [Tulasnella sp. 408]
MVSTGPWRGDPYLYNFDEPSNNLLHKTLERVEHAEQDLKDVSRKEYIARGAGVILSDKKGWPGCSPPPPKTSLLSLSRPSSERVRTKDNNLGKSDLNGSPLAAGHTGTE